MKSLMKVKVFHEHICDIQPCRIYEKVCMKDNILKHKNWIFAVRFKSISSYV